MITNDESRDNAVRMLEASGSVMEDVKAVLIASIEAKNQHIAQLEESKDAHEKSTSEAQETIIKAGESQINALTQDLEDREEALRVSSAHLSEIQEREEALIVKCAALETAALELRSDDEWNELVEEKQSLSMELEKALIQVEELTIALDEAETIQREEFDQDIELKVTTEDLAMKDEEIDQLREEIELLKTELNAANDCIEAEMQQQQDQQQQTQGIMAELQARLEIAAQELTSQQRAIEQMKEEEKERLVVGTTDDSLMIEMNALLEGKIEAETRADKAESDAKSLQDQLSKYDRNTATEQEIIMKAAESQMNALTQDLEDREEALRVSSVQLLEIQEREEVLAAKCITLEKAVAEKEGMVGELEGDLTAAEEARDAAVLSLKASKTQNKIEAAAIEEARDAAVRALETSGSSLEEYKAEMVAALAVKDQRIAHLEVSKLTKEQMEKIKQLKDEHKQSREDVKTMKKQLVQLKKAYDDLKDSSVLGPSSTDCAALISAQETITFLTNKLQESATKLENTQNTAKALKEKIKDCSKQLQVLIKTVLQLCSQIHRFFLQISLLLLLAYHFNFLIFFSF